MADNPISWGIVPDGTFERVVLFSPHFDDAALGAAHMLCAHPDSLVVTVMGGPPAQYPDPPSEWDALGGFQAGDDVVALRREEDVAALKVLDARPLWLEFVDYQYLQPDERATPETIAVEMARVDRRRAPDRGVPPDGTREPRSRRRRTTPARCSRRQRPDLAWFCYEDSGYKHIPGMLAWRIAKLFRSDLWPTPMIVPTDVDHDRKRTSIECYQSQLGPLNRDHALHARIGGSVPEQFWMLAPPPAGWERMRDT